MVVLCRHFKSFSSMDSKRKRTKMCACKGLFYYMVTFKRHQTNFRPAEKLKIRKFGGAVHTEPP